jgi:hypothetical protein
VKLSFGGPSMSFLGSSIEYEAWIEYVEFKFNSSQLVLKNKKKKKKSVGAKKLICTIVDSKSLNILAIRIVLNILRVFYQSGFFFLFFLMCVCVH